MPDTKTYISKNQVHLGIVCPMANEKENIRAFIPAVLDECRGFQKVSFFPVLDNATYDGTADIVRELEGQYPELKMVWAPENRCVVDAYLRGYQEAIDVACDWILEIDAGFSHQPGEIHRFFDVMVRGYDCAFGSRFCKDGLFTNASRKRYLISKGGTCLANLLLGTTLKDMTSGFEIFTRSTLKQVLAKGIHSRGHFFQTEIKAFCRTLNFAEVPITYSNPSNRLGFSVLADAFSNLWRLFKLRLQGRL